MDLLAGLVAIAGIALYFLPTLIALKRRHGSTPAIFLVNVLVGWTLIVWVIALIWAASGKAGGSDLTRTCPHCRERVHFQANVCPHCLRDLKEPTPPPAPPAPAREYRAGSDVYEIK